MRSWLACILLFLVSAPLLAQTSANPQTSTTTTTTTTTKTKKRAATAKKPAAKPTTASEIKTLRDAVSAQQQQIQVLRDELQRRDSAMQQVQQQLNSLQSATQQAQTTAQAAESCCKENGDALASLKTTVGTVQTMATATSNSLLATDKRVTTLENPLAIKYKGINITPGGFISANVNWRQHNQNLDNFGSFGALPFSGTSNGHLTEFRATGRYSRISLLAEGKTKGFNVQSYYEMDFEGAAQTANENQTNSFQPRIRELWANVDAPHGVSFTGGQTWSLITANRTGVGPRGLALPSHISASLHVGFHYTRQGTFRVYKKWDMGNKKAVYLAFAAENSETVTAGSSPTGFTIFGLQGSASGNPGAAGSNCAVDRTVVGLAPCSTFASNTSIDAAPDLIGKVAIEPGWGHFELGLLGRFFRDRILLPGAIPTAPTAIAGPPPGPPVGTPGAVIGGPNLGSNHTTPALAVSVNAVLPVVAKKVDLVITSLAGPGVGRYGTTGIPDAVFRPDGRLEPVKAYTGSLGIETHPTPKLDFNVYLGDEYTKRLTYYTGGTALLPTGTGYGLISQDLRGCNLELPTIVVTAVTPFTTAAFGCAASNKNVYEIAPGFWYRFYRGPAGTLQFGAYYSYFYRSTWAGRVTATGAGPLPLHASQSEILTAFRWYFP